MKYDTTQGKVTAVDRAARAVSRVTNPCLLSILFLLAFAYFISIDIRNLFIWFFLLLLFLVVLPLIYVYARKTLSKSSTKFLTDPTTFLKQHPKDVLVTGILFGLPIWIIMVFLKAPSALLDTIMALLVSSFIIALFYKHYRISYHVTAVTTLVCMAIITWGPYFAFLAVLVPLVGWAKYRLHEHTIVQMVIAVVLSIIVTIITVNLL